MEQNETEVSGGEATHDTSGDHQTTDASVPQAVADKFAELFGTGSGDAGEAQATAQQNASQSEADELEEARLADEAAKRGSDKPAAKTEQKPAVTKPGEEAPATLDPALKHAAKRAGWSDEELADDIKTYGVERVQRTLAKLHGSYNDLSERYAQLGAARSQQLPGQPTQPAQPQQAKANDPFAALEALFEEKTLKQFAENNGEEIVEKFMKPLHAALQPLKEIQARYEADTKASQQREVTGIFKGWETDFADLYGSGDQLTPAQVDARLKVGQMADQIAAGAAAQGIDLTISEALDRAHSHLTKDRVKEMARKEITSAVAGRAKAITSRPTQRRTVRTVNDGAAKGDDAAQNAVAAFWAERGR